MTDKVHGPRKQNTSFINFLYQALGKTRLSMVWKSSGFHKAKESQPEAKFHSDFNNPDNRQSSWTAKISTKFSGPQIPTGFETAGLRPETAKSSLGRFWGIDTAYGLLL